MPNPLTENIIFNDISLKYSTSQLGFLKKNFEISKLLAAETPS